MHARSWTTCLEVITYLHNQHVRVYLQVLYNKLCFGRKG